jgi:ATP-dependent helicase/DNAse subunit B
MHLLITGPPASGKSRAALEVFLADPSSTLLTPSSTMAEHVSHELARANVPIRPNRIQTLAKFIEPFTDLQEAPESLVHLLVAQQHPAEFPGYHRALAALVRQVPDLPSAKEIENQMEHLGRALREKRLRAVHPIQTGPIILDGFFTFSPAELDLIEKLQSVTVTLPDWPGSESAKTRLRAAGFEERHQDQQLRQPTKSVFAALSQEQECEQIAARILKYSAAGREFREMGIILRSRDPYAAALETTLARFGIPARFHFTDPLSAHPAVQYLSGLIRQAELLPLLRMPISGIGATPEGDVLDFKIRESLPTFGWRELQLAASASADVLFSAFRQLDDLKRGHLTPQDWSETLKSLRLLIPQPEITDQATHQQLQIWRSIPAALEAFDTALDTTALALPDTKITLAQFWPNAETTLSIEKLRVPDRRRNVVNILDVYEARQWELRIAFVCGLTERHFPQYHREDPLLNDEARRQAGLPTSEDRQQEEHFLFKLATTRATEETILSYARYNDKGDAQLRSFFLPEEGAPSNPIRIIPKPKSFVSPVGQVPDLPSVNLRKHHAKLSPSSIESFLQCPFQFFASKTLKLRQRPPKPRERLNALLQGSILHNALAEYTRTPMFGASWLDRVFEDECRKNNIPHTYRKEAVRLELLRHFEAFLLDNQWPLTWPARTEEKFEIPLNPELSIRGRIDRLDTGPNNQAIVIDYKYSAAARIKQHLDTVQGGLYLLAAERYFNLHPAGVFFCGLRQSVTWEGWHTSIPGLALGEARKDLTELIASAQQKAIETFETIASGNVEVRPTDRDKCRYCDFNDICRIESQVQVETAK